MTIKKISRSAVFQAGIKVLTAAFVTFILMYISSNVYQKPPFELEFQTKQHKELTYQVFYTTDSKNPFGFNQKQSVRKRVSAGLHTERIILPIKNIVQLRFDFGSYPGEVSVLKIVLKGKNEQVLNLKDFRFVNIDSHDFQNNQLTIVSNQGDPFIIHQKPLNMPYHPIDWCFFFGLLCIYGFVSYALISYLSTLKISGKHSLFRVIFLCLFFGVLVLPIMNISNEEKSIWENRMLAKKPVVSEIFKEKSEYGKAFEKWYNDHFFGRNQMMIVHDEIRNKVNKILKANNFLYFKENGWVFIPPIWSLNPSSKLIQLVMQNVKKLNEFCRENNIKLYLLMSPRKDFVYQEFLYDYGFDKKQYNRLNEIYATLKKGVQKLNVPFVYPFNEMQEAKQEDYVFFQLTNHWTDWGAYIGYQALMKEIQKDFQDIPVVTLNEYDKSQNKLIRDNWDRVYYKEGYLKNAFHLKPDEEKALNYTYYDHKNKNLLQIKKGEYTKDFSYSFGKYRVMLIGDSQNDNLNQFLPYSVNELKFIRVNRKPVPKTEQWKIMKLYKKDILSFKPDILILSFSDTYLKDLQLLFSN